MSDSTAVLNAATLTGLRDMVGDAFNLVINSHVEDGVQLIGNLNSAADQGNLEQIAEVAHAIKGSFSNIGADMLADLCKKIEIEAKDGQSDVVLEQIPEIIREMERVIKAAKELL